MFGIKTKIKNYRLIGDVFVSRTNARQDLKAEQGRLEQEVEHYQKAYDSAIMAVTYVLGTDIHGNVLMPESERTNKCITNAVHEIRKSPKHIAERIVDNTVSCPFFYTDPKGLNGPCEKEDCPNWSKNHEYYRANMNLNTAKGNLKSFCL